MTRPLLVRSPSTGFLDENLERLLGGALLVLAGVVLLARFDAVFHASRALLGLPPRFWVMVGAVYLLAQLSIRSITGVGHYAGWKKGLAVIDLAVVGAAVHVTGGPLSVLWPLYILQVSAMGLSHETEAASEARGLAERGFPGWYPWYWPALFLAWFLPVRAWHDHYANGRLGFDVDYDALAAAQFASIAIMGLFVQGLGRVSFRRLVGDAVGRAEAELTARLAEEGAFRERRETTPTPAEDEKEVMNWSNLTAGLTHSIGNEIHAIDTYGGEILAFLEAHPELEPTIRERVQFIYDTNKARFGFMSFLQEFAEYMKSHKGRRPIPRNLKTIQLDDLIKEVREKVGRFESRELDTEDPDHQVQSQLSKNLHLEIFTKFEPAEKRSITKARRPVLEFVLYEFIKNALRNCSGRLKLKALVECRGEWVTIKLINDLNVETRKPPPGKPGLGCSGCKRIVPELYWVANSDFLDAYCDDCLRSKVEANLGECWEPGKSSQWGKGLGLFVIRYFLTRYYFGKTECGIINWPTREVYFQLTIPDDLEQAIERHNVRFDTKAMKRISTASDDGEGGAS